MIERYGRDKVEKRGKKGEIGREKDTDKKAGERDMGGDRR